MTATIWAVIPAAGIGSRFESSVPKQYAILAGKTLLEHAIAALLESGVVSTVTIGVAPDDEYFRQTSIVSNQRLRIIEGGASRAETVLECLRSLCGVAQASDWVMVHDAARPLVSPQDIARLCTLSLESARAAILAKRVTDTVKQTESSDSPSAEKRPNSIANTLDREMLWLAQTPQIAPFQVLLDGLEKFSADDDLSQVTDEASVLERLGHEVMLVESLAENFKVTRPEDLILAEAIIGSRRAK